MCWQAAGATTGPHRSEALRGLPGYWSRWIARGPPYGNFRAESVSAFYMAQLLYLMAGVLHLLPVTVSPHATRFAVEPV